MNSNSVANEIEKKTGLVRSKKHSRYQQATGRGVVAYGREFAGYSFDGDFHIANDYGEHYLVKFDSERCNDKIDEIVDVLNELGMNNVELNESFGTVRSVRFEMLDDPDKWYGSDGHYRKGEFTLNKWSNDYHLFNKDGSFKKDFDAFGHSPSSAKKLADMYIEEYKQGITSSKQLNSRFYQSAISKYTLSEAAQYMAALFFDLRSIHFLTTGNEFYTYHKLAEDLYEQTEDYYDDLIETAIGYDSDISAMYVLPGDWDSVNTDGSFDSNGQVPQTLILDRLEKIYDVLESVKDYDSMVKSKIDAMLEYYDKEIYKLKQALK